MLTARSSKHVSSFRLSIRNSDALPVTPCTGQRQSPSRKPFQRSQTNNQLRNFQRQTGEINRERALYPSVKFRRLSCEPSGDCGDRVRLDCTDVYFGRTKQKHAAEELKSRHKVIESAKAETSVPYAESAANRAVLRSRLLCWANGSVTVPRIE